jgi:hypothetical protein
VSSLKCPAFGHLADGRRELFNNCTYFTTTLAGDGHPKATGASVSTAPQLLGNAQNPGD